MKRIFSLTAAAVFALSTASAHPAGEPQTQNETAMTTHTLTSKYSFDETVSRLETAIKSKGMNIFAVIDHQEAARRNGSLTMQPAKVIVFGMPKAGTPLMVKDPAFALQLPLRVLVTETDGKVRAAYTDTRALIAGSRIGFDEVVNTLANAEKLIQKTVGE
ncbi:DUF302 domain-containing protein [Neisseria blantyrii]|uniref:DUF302 domain-containing protein n=1 Tax=Neisseria blantyrii TaxID=2830647 RepID=UPI00272D1480|nr:DUF302 domain-containing protein [Neisseria blantyrii]